MGGINTLKKGVLSLLFILAIAVNMGLTACENSEIKDDNEKTEETSELNQNEGESTKKHPETKLEIDKNAPTQKRIEQLKEIAMIYYTGQGDLAEAEEIFAGKSFEKKNDVVEEAFKQASLIDPYDMDLMYSLASVYIFKRDIPAALEVYDQMLNLDKDQFRPQVMKTIFSKVNGDKDSYKDSLNRLYEIDADKAKAYEEKIEFVDGMKALTFNTEVPTDLAEKQHAFVVLGYALSDEGEMQDTLKERLQIALEAAEEYPDSKIIVTGGVPKNGVTEADVMYDWLVEQGIDEERIIKENMATDTIENALFSMDIVQEEGLKDITLITSATHMRRALSLFNEADVMIKKKDDQKRELSHVVYYDYDDDESDDMSKAEEIVIYRDLIRTSGIWLFPNLYR